MTLDCSSNTFFFFLIPTASSLGYPLSHASFLGSHPPPWWWNAPPLGPEWRSERKYQARWGWALPPFPCWQSRTTALSMWVRCPYFQPVFSVNISGCLMELFHWHISLSRCNHSRHFKFVLTEQLFPTKLTSQGEKKKKHKQHTCNLLNLNYSDKHIALFIETFCPMLGTVLNILHTDSHLFFFLFFQQLWELEMKLFLWWNWSSGKLRHW